jgi:hypothetical protein
MPDKITFYAIVDEETSVDKPSGLLRRLEFGDEGFTDEGLRRDFSWDFTPMIVEWERSDLGYELVEVSHAQASRIIEYFREKWGPYGQPVGS